MLNRSTFRLVLLVSLAHALVHIFEHSFACVEQLVVSDDTFAILSEVRKQTSGQLGSTLRLPFGLCALLAGWLADRYGSKCLLQIYLVGASAAALLTFWSPNLAAMYASMFVLGMFASIYHPATINRTPKTRPTGTPTSPCCSSPVWQGSSMPESSTSSRDIWIKPA